MKDFDAWLKQIQELTGVEIIQLEILPRDPITDDCEN